MKASGFSEEEVQEFRAEAEELLDAAEKSLLILDNGGEFKLEYDAVFRAFHSIKGAAGMMDLTVLQAHMHELENLLTEQKQKVHLEKNLIDHFLAGSDAARRILRGETVSFDHHVNKTAPPQKPEPSLAKPESESHTATSLGKVLIVDDEPDLVNVLVNSLESMGFTAYGMTNPTSILAELARFQPDVVITDYSMPNMNGIQLLHAVHGVDPELPVIILSGYVEKNILLDAISEGVFGVIEKPFNVVRVGEVCENAASTYRINKLLNSSINLLMYQFSDLDNFLKTSGKDDVRKIINEELNRILEMRRTIRKTNKTRRS